MPVSRKALSPNVGNYHRLSMNTVGMAMTTFAGMDRLEYPGDHAMDALKSTNLAWTGFYLAPAPYQPNESWMTKRDALVTMGWGLAPLYLGRQADSDHLNAAQGIADADNAVALAAIAGFPTRATLFYDFEGGDPPSSHALEYYAAWVQRVADNGALPGVYCSYINAAKFISVDGRPIVWATKQIFKPGDEVRPPYSVQNPGDCGYPDAAMWQYALNVNTVVGSSTINGIDFSTSLMSDPSRERSTVLALDRQRLQVSPESLRVNGEALVERVLRAADSAASASEAPRLFPYGITQIVVEFDVGATNKVHVELKGPERS